MAIWYFISRNRGSEKKNMKKLAFVATWITFGGVVGCVVILYLMLGDYIYIQRQNLHAFVMTATCVVFMGRIGSKSQRIPIRGVVIYGPSVHSWLTLRFILFLVLPACVFTGILGAAQGIYKSGKKDKELSDGEKIGDGE